MSASYASTGKAVMDDLLVLHGRPIEEWSISKFGDAESKVYTRRSENPACMEDILRAATLLKNTTMNHTYALLAPWLPYRTQWDELLDSKTNILETSDDGLMRVVHHVTRKKFPISARDTVDVISINRVSPSLLLLASRSIHDFPNAPAEQADVVRTENQLGGYVLEQQGNDVMFTMYFHSDLKLNAPRLIASVVSAAKPKFAVDKLRALAKATKDNKPSVSEEHLAQCSL